MGIQHVNRKGDTYYLHEGKTKSGKPMWFFSKKSVGTLAESIPAGYEIHEKLNGQVFLRAIPPRLITDEELAIVERGMRDYAQTPYYILDIECDAIVVATADNDIEQLSKEFSEVYGIHDRKRVEDYLVRTSRYSPMMRFRLVDPEDRRFSVDRWCFKGSLNRWITLLAASGDLESLVEKYVRHLGSESFYHLI